MYELNPVTIVEVKGSMIIAKFENSTECQKAPTSQAPATQGPKIFGRHKAHDQNA